MLAGGGGGGGGGGGVSGQFPKNVLRSMHFLPVQPGTVSTTEPVVES